MVISGNLSLDLGLRQVTIDGRLIELEPKVFDLMVFLLCHPNEVATKDVLIDAVWGGRIVSDGAVTQTIAKLRKALKDSGHVGGEIKTVPKVGYRWQGEVVQPDAGTISVPDAAPDKPAASLLTARKSRRMPLYIGLTALIVLVVSLLAPTPSQEQVTLAVLPFAIAADTDMDWAQLGLPALLDATINTRTNLRVVSASRVRSSLKTLGVTDDASADQQLAAIRDLMGADHLLQVQVDRQDGGYRLNYQLTGGKGGTLAGEMEAARVDDLTYMLASSISEDLDVTYEAGIRIKKFSNDNYVNETFARGMHALLTGESSGAKSYFETALAGDSDLHWARYELGNALQLLGDWNGSKAAFQQVVTAARAESDLNLAGAAASGLGVIAWRQGDLDSAQEYFYRAREWFAAVENRANLASALGNLGILADNRQAWDDARDLYGEALSLYRTEGERFGESAVYSNLAVLERKLGQIDKAAEFQLKAIEIQQRVGLKQMLTFSLTHAGTIEMMRGNWSAAASRLSQALTQAQEQQDPLGEADARSSLALLRLDEYQLSEAQALLEQALGVYEELENVYGKVRVYLSLSRIAGLRGNTVEALEHAQAAQQAAEGMDDRSLQISVLLALADASSGEAAQVSFANALTQAQELGDKRTLAQVSLARDRISPEGDKDALVSAVDYARQSGDRRLEALGSIALGLESLRGGELEGVGALLSAAELWQPRYVGALHLRACYLYATDELAQADQILMSANAAAIEAETLVPLSCE